jgi:hypothetical protein
MDHHLEIVLADKAGEFARVVEVLVKEGLHIKTAALNYEGGVTKGAKPTAYFTVDSSGAHKIAGLKAALGESIQIKELKTTSEMLKIKPNGLPEALRNFRASAGGMCSFLYIDRGDPEPFAAVTFFAKG